MKHNIILYVLLVTVLLIAGCDSNQSNTGGLNPFIGGSKAINMDFVANSPPPEINNLNFGFSIAVRLENVGESDIRDGFLEVRGISPQEFGVNREQLRQDIPEIRGARKISDGSVSRGSAEVVSFDDLSYNQQLTGNLRIDRLQVRACYDYQTRVSTLLCIKEGNIDGMKDNEICRVDSNKRVSNSGAPIHVTQVTQSSRGDRGIQISFEISHVGSSSNRWFPKGDDMCDDRINNQDMYKVGVTVHPIINGQYAASCTSGNFNSGNTGVVTLHSGQPTRVVCRFDIGDQMADFETPLSIELDYRYMQSVETSLVIRDMNVN